MATNKSRIIPGRYPPPGTSPEADAIRARRGARGITELDAALLRVPPVAGGWNELLGAVRTKGKLPGDVREIMILRVAALNHAAYEWIHHEPVGRTHGLTSAQLYVVRDTDTPLPPSAGILSPLQSAALCYADASTRVVKIGKDLTDALMTKLRAWVSEQEPTLEGEVLEARSQDLLVEAAAVVASYNMVSRFLVAVDVAGSSDDQVPWPVERKEHFIPILSDSGTQTHTIHALSLVSSPSYSWIVFANSLLTDLNMWAYVVPHLLPSYNILLHSQRGHGLSTLPPPSEPKTTTIPSIASDIAYLLTSLTLPTPVHSIIGVSQGGAASLAFGRSYPGLTKSVIACDTAAKTPEGNKEAWIGRVAMVCGEDVLSTGGDDDVRRAREEYAGKVGMGKLASATVPRWFPPGSKCGIGSEEGKAEREGRGHWVAGMVQRTNVEGFVAGAGALGDYDLYQPDANAHTLLTSPVSRVLLLAGSLDGGGNVGRGLERLMDEWNAKRAKDAEKKLVEYVCVEGAGHLPMIDESEKWAEVVGRFLSGI